MAVDDSSTVAAGSRSPAGPARPGAGSADGRSVVSGGGVRRAWGTSGVGAEGVVPEDLPSRVFDELFDLVICGTLPAGELLPSERSLTERFGVNRQVVREAVKRLTYLGLVTADRGNGTRVQDWRRTGTFDLMPLLVDWALGGRGPDPLFTARHLLELRLTFALATTQLCCVHASDEQLEQFVDAALAVAGQPDVAQQFAAEWRMWAIAAEGSGNIALTLMLNSLRRTAGSGLLLMARASYTVPGDPEELVDVARVVATRDLVAADRAVRQLYRIEPTAELLDAEARVVAERSAGSSSPEEPVAT